jgi:hypothetical protein
MKSLYRIALAAALTLSLFSAAITPISAQTTAELPVLITSIGQSPGPVYFRVFMNRLGYDFVFNSLATVEDMAAGHEDAGSFRSIIIVTGASGKGMGAAGISIEDELARADRLIAQARSLGLKIIGAHIEGMERRAQGAAPGDNTDELSIDAVCPNADMLLVMEEGNEDGRFSNIATDAGIPIVLFEKLTSLSDVLPTIFGN